MYIPRLLCLRRYNEAEKRFRDEKLKAQRDKAKEVRRRQALERENERQAEQLRQARQRVEAWVGQRRTSYVFFF